jgi:hypothetical protein
MLPAAEAVSDINQFVTYNLHTLIDAAQPLAPRAEPIPVPGSCQIRDVGGRRRSRCLKAIDAAAEVRRADGQFAWRARHHCWVFAQALHQHRPDRAAGDPDRPPCHDAALVPGQRRDEMLRQGHRLRQVLDTYPSNRATEGHVYDLLNILRASATATEEITWL